MEIKDHPILKAKSTLHELLDWLEENDFSEKTKNKCWKALIIVSNLPYTEKKNK